jgi:hypothetical protein
MTPFRAGVVVAIGMLCAIAVSACDAQSAAHDQTNCSGVPGLQSAVAASAGKHFEDITLPAGTMGVTATAPEANGFQYRVVTACVTGQPPAEVSNFVYAKLTAQGWAGQTTAPVTGSLSDACPARAICYAKRSDTTRFAVMEQPSVRGTATWWVLRLIVQPLASGETSLSGSNNKLDVDPTGLNGGKADLAWNGSTLSLTNGAQAVSLGLRGSLNSTTYQDLSAAAYSAAALTGTSLSTGTVLALRTGDGHYAKVRISEHSGAKISLTYVTYAYAL